MNTVGQVSLQEPSPPKFYSTQPPLACPLFAPRSRPARAPLAPRSRPARAPLTLPPHPHYLLHSLLPPYLHYTVVKLYINFNYTAQAVKFEVPSRGALAHASHRPHPTYTTTFHHGTVNVQPFVGIQRYCAGALTLPGTLPFRHAHDYTAQEVKFEVLDSFEFPVQWGRATLYIQRIEQSVAAARGLGIL